MTDLGRYAAFIVRHEGLERSRYKDVLSLEEFLAATSPNPKPTGLPKSEDLKPGSPWTTFDEV